MMTRTLALALALAALVALTGCTSGGGSPFERLLPQVEQTVFGGPVFGEEKEAPPPVELTRAQLNQIPFATISVEIEDAPRGYVVAVADQGGNVVYQDQGRRSLIFRGGLMVATGGLSYDLKAVKHEQGADPVVERRPLADWPELITRNYQFALRAADDFEITVRCSYRPIVRETIEIVELSFDLTRVEETCRNRSREFTNVYWVDATSGFIWKSRQWVGPRQPTYQIEVIRPYEGT